MSTDTPKDINQHTTTEAESAWEISVRKNISANPDLPADFVRRILMAKGQATEPFTFEE